MKKLKTLAALSAFLLLVGCSTGNKPDDADTPDTSTSKSDSEKPTDATNFDPDCKMDYFAFSVEEPFKIKDASSIDDDISMYFLELSGSTAQFSVYEQDSFLTPQTYMEDLADMYSEENGFIEPSWEFLQEGELTKAVFCCKTETSDGLLSGLRKYCVLSNGRVLVLDEAFELDDEENVISASEKFLDTVSYYSLLKLPTSQWTESNEYFTITADPKWRMEYSQCNGDFRYYSLKYSQTDSKQRTKVWVDFQADTSKTFATAKDFLDDMFIEDATTKMVERSTIQFLEHYDTQLAEYIDGSGFITRILAFTEDDVVFSIGYCYPIDDIQAEKDVQELLDGFETGRWIY